MAFSDLVAAADRAAMAALGGELVTYAPATGSPVRVTGIFDAQFVLAKGDAQAGVEALGPAVFFRFSDLPVDPEDDDPTLTIRGNSYRVVERMPDDMGGIVLALRRIATTLPAITGTAAITEALDTLAGAALVAIAGAATPTQGAQTLTGHATAAIAAAATLGQAAQALSGAATAAISGSATPLQAAETLAASGTVVTPDPLRAEFSAAYPGFLGTDSGIAGMPYNFIYPGGG